MSFGLDVLTRYPGFGYGWSKKLSFVFAGVTQVEVAGGGCVNVIWPAEITAESFNIYIKADTSSGLFDAENLLGKYPNTTTRALIRTEADNTTLLQSTKKYYIGVKSEDEVFGEDENTTFLSVRPLGGEPVFVNDRHVSKVL